MADIRKRVWKNGATTYVVRHPDKSSKGGYSYATFKTLKEAREFLEGGKAARNRHSDIDTSIRQVSNAVERWLKICEKEGTDGNEPVTNHTLKNYEYFADFMNAYDWPKDIQDLTPPDIVEFRSWLLANTPSRYVARKTLSYFSSVLHEMALRAYIGSNPVAGVGIREDSRYDEPVVTPTKKDVAALLKAADSLANSKNEQIRNTWKRYRPILYLAADSGMRPQEYLALADYAVQTNGVKVDRAIEAGSQKISVTKTPAGRRFIELSAHTLDMVRHYLKHETKPNDFQLVFPTATGKWLCPRNWRKRGFYVACEKAGLIQTKEVNGKTVEEPKYQPYDLRHFYASALIAKKVNIKKVQRLMGHNDIETTLNVYGHLIEDMPEETDAGVLSQLDM